MKNIFIAGNWKSNKTIIEAKEWANQFTVHSSQSMVKLGGSQVIVLAPFTVLSPMSEELKNQNIHFVLGAQDISKFDEGAYTGEVTGKMIKEVADWVIIGHSERRKYFGETDADLAAKVEKAHAAGLKVIFCVPDDTTPIPAGVEVIGYEPVWAIGTGKTDSPENANAVVTSIKQKTGAPVVIYGGSVTADNVASFIATASIDGVLPGGASLDPEKFIHLIHAALDAAR
jgi:triosephosphate isomerase (TIM)